MPASLAEVRLAKLQRLRELQGEAALVKQAVARYYNDPVGFAQYCIRWDSDGLTAYQEDILRMLQDNRRLAVRGPHGLGKSCIAAITVLWFALTRDSTGTDWKIITTAGSWRQLINYLWPEIRKWSSRLIWSNIRETPFKRAELLNLNLRLTHGAATAAACTNPALIEGAHADSLLLLLDEAKAIDTSLFDAVEGALSGTGEAFALTLSTPGPPQGRFYDIHARKNPGLSDWHVRHVTIDEAMAAGRISPSWMEQRRLQWGEASALYQNRVLGEFHSSEEDSVIPLSWVEAAVERWHDWDDAGRLDPGRPHTVGIDVARSGADKTVMAIRQDQVVTELRVTSLEDTMQTAARAKGILDADPLATGIVDIIGVGAGVYDRLREQGCRVQAFNAAAKTNRRDSTGELGFVNTRAAAWQNMRELLDPSAGSDVCLPPDDDLLGDLTAPKAAEVAAGGRLKVESKDDIFKRLARSTDRADAVVQAFWAERGSWSEAYGTRQCGGCGRGFLRLVDGEPRTHCPHCQTPVPADEDEG